MLLVIIGQLGIFSPFPHKRQVFINFPHGLGSQDGNTYYKRPYIAVKLVGASVYKVLNDQRFSYGAGLSNINLRYSREIGNDANAKVGFSPNYLLRLGGGYTTNKWGLSLQWIILGRDPF